MRQDARTQAQRDLHPDGRRRLRRFRLLRPDAHRNAQHRLAGSTRHPLHRHVFGRSALVARPLRPADGHAHGTRPDPRQRRDDRARRRVEPRSDAARLDARRTGPAQSGHADARLGDAAGRLPHGDDRQVGRRRPRHREYAQQDGLRRIFRLHLPATGALLLSAFPLGERPPHLSGQRAAAPGARRSTRAPIRSTRTATTNIRSRRTAPTSCTTACCAS